MTDRDRALAAFLAASPCAGWQAVPMAGDASARRFLRLTGPGGETAILMDADPARGEDLGAFLRIAAHLRAAGLAAPEERAADAAAGFAIVEDLGPRHVAAWLADRPGDEGEIYGAAVDLLARLQTVAPPPGLTALGPLRGAALVAPLFDFYCPTVDERGRAHVTGLVQQVLAAHAPLAETLSLRDFHAENLIWRPDRQGTDRLGLVDFQDAVLAAPEYDLVSLLRDARRDVGDALRHEMIARFALATGRPLAGVDAACAAIGVQRNLRILGIFARLARTEGKRRYVAFMPRVWRMLADDLRHPALAPLAQVLDLPAPAAAGFAT